MQTRTERVTEAMSMRDVAEFKTAAKVGTSVYIRVIADNPYNKKKVANGWVKTSITGKAPHVATTMKGTYRWIDLCIWQREHKARYGY